MLTFDAVVVDGFGVIRAEFGVGCHTILCDGSSVSRAFVALVAGEVAPRRGKVLVDGRSPASQPLLRRRIGTLPVDATLPGGMTVHDSLRTIAALRHQAVDWSRELANWGLGSWLERRTASLAWDERRAIALVAALTTDSTLAIALHAPFSGVAALDPERVAERLQTASEGAVVVVFVTEPRQARLVVGSQWILRPGRVEALDAALLAPERLGGTVSMRVRCERPRELVAELALCREVIAVAFSSEPGDGSVWLRGVDARALSVALLRAANDTGAALWSWELVRTPLPIIAAAHDGSVQGAYHRAWHAAQVPRGGWGGAPPSQGYVSGRPNRGGAS